MWTDRITCTHCGVASKLCNYGIGPDGAFTTCRLCGASNRVMRVPSADGKQMILKVLGLRPAPVRRPQASSMDLAQAGAAAPGLVRPPTGAA